MNSPILFDFDGTLVDSGRVIIATMRLAFLEEGLEARVEEVDRRFIGPPPHILLMEEFGLPEARAREVTQTYRKLFRQDRWRQIEPYSGIISLLKELRAAGASLAIATTRPEDTTELILEHLDMKQYFATVQANRHDRITEDKLHLVEAALAAFPEKRRTACMVGDRRYDMKAAQDASIAGIFAAYGYGSPEEAAPYSPAFIAHSVESLRDYLLGGFL